jgi:hypothetical protein
LERLNAVVKAITKAKAQVLAMNILAILEGINLVMLWIKFP